MSYPQGPYPPPPGPYMPPPYGNPYQQKPKRSAIPMVIGILMICFGGLGLLGGLIGLSGIGGGGFDNPAFRGDPELGKFVQVMKDIESFQKYTSLIGIFTALFQVVVGIYAVKYRSGAPRMAITYAIVAIVESVGTMILFYAWISPALDGAPAMLKSAMGIGFFFGAIIGAAWPVIIWALMSRPTARAACVN